MTNPAPLQNQTFNVPAADANGNPGVVRLNLAGVLLMIQRATGPFTLQLNAGTPFTTTEGWKFNDPNNPFSYLTFFNYGAGQITIQIYVGSLGVDYVGAGEVKPAPTYALGNFGITNAGAIAKVFGQKVSAIVRTNGGNNYTVGDIMQPPDGTGVPAQIQVTEIDRRGGITGQNLIVAGNYSVLPATPSTPVGGTGNGATFTLTFANLTGAVLGFAAGWLTITNAGNLVIPNGLGDNARKSITIKVKAGSAGGLFVLDANGNTLRDLAVGDEETFETPGVLQIVADSANLCTFTTSELYYL